MKRREFLKTTCATGALTLLDANGLPAQPSSYALEQAFHHPPAEAGLSVVYHWTGGVVTREGITADMDGIAASGINTVNWFYFDGTGPQDGASAPACKTPEWWDMVEHLMKEAQRNHLTIAPHVCSSWGPAGSDAITPELSQQQLFWSETEIEGGRPFTAALAKPQRPQAAGRGARGGRGAAAPPAFSLNGRGVTFPDAFRDYYRDLAVFAFPVPPSWGETNVTRKARITTTLPITDLAKAVDPANTERVVTTDKPGYLQFAFDQPFTLRAVTVDPGIGAGGLSFGMQQPVANPYRIAHSLEVEASDDGTNFRRIGQLEPMFNGWQSTVSALTHTVKETTARYFRLVYTPGPPLGYDEGMRTGTRTGGGDFAHMIEPLGFAHIVLSSTATVHHLPGKNNSTWGKSRLVTGEEIPPSACVPLASIVDLTGKLRQDGTIEGWTPGPGKWRIQRIGYMSTLQSTGGGLQCDKLSADAARIVFESWFAEIRRRTPGAGSFVNVLNIDSWECRSQNWSPVLREEFRTRRGYDPLPYLPCMTGVMVQSATATEGFLLDLRRTISECIVDNHYATMHRLAHENGCIVMSEDINPAINVDGMHYYKNTDWTGGEFWVRASQNWKPNDIRDGVAGARIYGKKIVFAEAWTGGGWQDHPFALKAMGDHNYAEGLNRMMLHVWNEQYHPQRVPGMPGAGTPFNFLNTWWTAGQGWRNYMKRAQALLQQGQPTEDVLYFAGENIPCRSLLKPTQGSCWFTEPALPAGYTHDTINRDGLLSLARVRDGSIEVNGLAYRLLILKADEPYLTPPVAEKLRELVNAGATVYGPRPRFSPSNQRGAAGQETVRAVARDLWGDIDGRTVTEHRYGKGRVFWGAPIAQVLRALNAAPDVTFANLVNTGTGRPVVVDASSPTGTLPVAVGAERKGWGMEFCHRQGPGWDLYFLSNQEFFPVATEVSFRLAGRIPEFFHPDTGRIEEAPEWRDVNGRTVIPMTFDPAGSVFVLFRKPAASADPVVAIDGPNKGLRLARTAAALAAWAGVPGEWTLKTRSGKSIPLKAASVPPPVTIGGAWDVAFPVKSGPKRVQLDAGSWTAHSDDDVKFFSGTATYRKQFAIPAAMKSAPRLYLDLGDVENLARVRLNGHDLGVIWKAPYIVDITSAAVAGPNRLEIDVTNTWTNRILGDSAKPESERTTFVAPTRFGRGPQITEPLPAGLLGPVRITAEVKLI